MTFPISKFSIIRLAKLAILNKWYIIFPSFLSHLLSHCRPPPSPTTSIFISQSMWCSFFSPSNSYPLYISSPSSPSCLQSHYVPPSQFRFFMGHGKWNCYWLLLSPFPSCPLLYCVSTPSLFHCGTMSQIVFRPTTLGIWPLATSQMAFGYLMDSTWSSNKCKNTKNN